MLLKLVLLLIAPVNLKSYYPVYAEADVLVTILCSVLILEIFNFIYEMKRIEREETI